MNYNLQGSSTRPTLRIGSRGEAVMELQRLLASLGYSLGLIDGIFGPMTQNAVMSFQRDNGLAIDGIVGPITWNALLNATGMIPEIPERPELRIGSRGEAVIELQRLLTALRIFTWSNRWYLWAYDTKCSYSISKR